MSANSHQFLLDLYDCDEAVLDDLEAVARLTRSAAVAAGGTILHEKFHRVAPRGVAGVMALSDSQLTIQTQPAHRYAAVDLHRLDTSAAAPTDVERCATALRERLKSLRFSLTPIRRGAQLGTAPAPVPAHEANDSPTNGATSAPPAPHAYRPLHPELFRYDSAFVERFIDPAVARVTHEDAKRVTRELCEQLYQFRLFTPEFCRLLIEEAEHCGEWITILDRTVERHGALDDVDDVIEPDTSLSWERMPPLVDVYHEVIEHHVRPVVESLWVTFKLQKWDIPGVRKYEPDVVKGMDLHYDAETVGMVGYLSDGFEGGGTYFPRWDAKVGVGGQVIVGSVVVYPGGVSHEHLALPVTAGRRYCLSNSLY